MDELLGRELFFRTKVRSGLNFADFQLFLLSAAGKKPVVPDLCEAGRQDVHQEPPDKLVGTQRHLFPTAAVAVVPPLKCNRTIIVKHENAVVGNSHSVSVAPKIFDDTGGI